VVKVLKKMPICILLLGILLIGYLVERAFGEDNNFQYVPKVLFTVPYGTGGGYSVAVGVDEFGDDWGPSRLYVDKNGNIYIYDELNRKIKKFSKDGRLIFATEGKCYGGPFAVDENGNIFVVTGEKTVKYDNNGRFVHYIEYYPFGERTKIEKTKSMKSLSPEIAEIPDFNPPLIDGQGRRYEQHSDEWYENLTISIYNKSGSVIGSFTISNQTKQRLLQVPTRKAPPYYERLTEDEVNEINRRYLEAIRIIGVDKDGNLYGTSMKKGEKNIIGMIKNVRVAPPEGVFDIPIYHETIIYKYNPQGELISQFSYTSPQWGDSIEVDKDGNIYCLQFHKDGMDVVKYEWVEEGKKPTLIQMEKGIPTIKEEPEVPKVKKIKQDDQ